MRNTEQLDLQVDEFKRILALTENEEIRGLCERAVSKITQHTPVIAQRDRAIKERDQLKSENATLVAALKEAKAGLWKINTYPVHSEPVGGAMAMQDIANDTLATINKVLGETEGKP